MSCGGGGSGPGRDRRTSGRDVYPPVSMDEDLGFRPGLAPA